MFFIQNVAANPTSIVRDMRLLKGNCGYSVTVGYDAKKEGKNHDE